MKIDADAHAIECHDTWDFLRQGEEQYRPQAVTSDSGRAFWIIEGQIHPRDVGNPDIPAAIRELRDVPGRLLDMDASQVDVQVIYPTLFLQGLPSLRPEVQAALCGSYNRWMGEVSKQSNGRLLWAVLPPVLDIPAALEEMKLGREHGAVAVMLRGIEADALLDDPRLDSIYGLASQLDMAICVHAGNGNNAMKDVLYRKDLYFFGIAPILAGFNRILVSGVPDRFPGLRFGFLEAGSQWVPYLVREVARRAATIGIKGRITSLATLLRDKRIWVACRTDDDLPYVMQFSGSTQLVIGTDYGHEDPAAELDALDVLRTQPGVGSEVVDGIVGTNAQALYGIGTR